MIKDRGPVDLLLAYLAVQSPMASSWLEVTVKSMHGDACTDAIILIVGFVIIIYFSEIYFRRKEAIQIIRKQILFENNPLCGNSSPDHTLYYKTNHNPNTYLMYFLSANTLSGHLKNIIPVMQTGRLLTTLSCLHSCFNCLGGKVHTTFLWPLWK